MVIHGQRHFFQGPTGGYFLFESKVKHGGPTSLAVDSRRFSYISFWPIAERLDFMP